MGHIRQRDSAEIRTRALETARQKQEEGCVSCAASYLDLAREHGATDAEIRCVTQRAGMGRRRFMQMAAAAVAMGVAGTILTPNKASAMSKIDPGLIADRTQTNAVPGYFGTDSCTSVSRGTVEGMPMQYYIGELGATKHNAGCFDDATAAYVGPAFTHGYWGLCGPNYASNAADYGRQQAQMAMDAWNSNPSVGGRTIFADLEDGFGGWGGPATQADNVALLNAFLVAVSGEGFIPGVYINRNNRTQWFPADYKAPVPFVYWVAGGRLAGTMCAPCQPHCETLHPTVNAWTSDVQRDTFGGQAAALWQYWLSDFGCAGDFNYSPQTGYTKFVPVSAAERAAAIAATPTPTPSPATTTTPNA